MKKYIYVLWIIIFSLSLGGCSKDEDCDPNDDESPCYAGLADGGKGIFECSYKVTIDGQTTVPNQFGQDKIVIQTSGGNADAETVIFTLGQAKVKPQETAVFTFMAYGAINSEVPVQTTYPVAAFQSTSLISTSVSTFPLYGYADGQKDYGKLTLTLVENSDQRIRMKVTGTVMKLDQIGNDIEEMGFAPLEAEITIGRKHFTDASVDGILSGGGGVCECQ